MRMESLRGELLWSLGVVQSPETIQACRKWVARRNCIARSPRFRSQLVRVPFTFTRDAHHALPRPKNLPDNQVFVVNRGRWACQPLVRL